MPAPAECEVRWTDGTFGVRPGTLTVAEDRLVLSTSGGKEVFSLPAANDGDAKWPGVEWPKWSFDSAFRVRVADRCYKVTFIPHTNSLRTWSLAMKEGAEWKARLVPGFVPGRARDSIIQAFVFLMRLLTVVFGLLLGLGLAANPDGKWYDVFFGCMGMLWAAANGVLWIMEGRKAKHGG